MDDVKIMKGLGYRFWWWKVGVEKLILIEDRVVLDWIISVLFVKINANFI
jgi:hypothetical protein